MKEFRGTWNGTTFYVLTFHVPRSKVPKFQSSTFPALTFRVPTFQRSTLHVPTLIFCVPTLHIPRSTVQPFQRPTFHVPTFRVPTFLVPCSNILRSNAPRSTFHASVLKNMCPGKKDNKKRSVAVGFGPGTSCHESQF